MRGKGVFARTVEAFDGSATVTLIITAWFAFMGAALLGSGALVLGAFCFFACGMNFSRWLRSKDGEPK